ncbi:DUF4124 domain-containing protein [Bermanella marisrubri]|uniref:DUF4124 domain-containing protein n=1 Tax=Bermanella marisrubri TaxID=207949 RepID=Q1MYZ2_9GAMM|nr:DUF4124 domain-containing protein [Bermanella marisrubri]EAT11236.1 hypothetical protein RED65_07404 [Oceanobacter sp. RED65] [Bermanella marisrubri]QIZ85631.1 DUF4124 domain-containing protein [Bermanella marisrubri]
MKIFYKLIILALLLAFVSPFLIKGSNGQPLWDIKRWFQEAKYDAKHSIQSAKQSVSQSLLSLQNDDSTQTPQASGLYRYRDDNGKWVYTDQKPKGHNVESVTLKEEVATLKTITLPEGFGEKHGKDSKTEKLDLNQGATPFTTAPLSELPKTMKNLEAIQEKFEKRQQELDQAIQ